MKVLVTGAAGYIGSVVAEQLIDQGNQVVALDNLSHGHRSAVHPSAKLLVGDLSDQEWTRSVLREHEVDAVVHLAAEALIAESVRDPGRFYRANLIGGFSLLEAMKESGVRRMIFSSTAAVYGEPRSVPIDESAPKNPVNSYGESKLAFERMLDWYSGAHGISYVTLRYFNACGATSRVGEHHVPETHIIPALFEVALGKREAFHLFGTDYDTPDGTCIRDYVHVADIASAHLLALRRLTDHEGTSAARHTFNLGNQRGYSNLEVVETVREVTGRRIPTVAAPRREGDPSRLVASSSRIREEFGWNPRYPDLRQMVESAWQWQLRNPKGYEA